MIITKKALPRRTFLRGHRRGGGAAAARRDGAVDDGAGRDAASRASAAPRLRLHADGLRPAALDAAGRGRSTNCRPRSARSRRSSISSRSSRNLELKNAYPGTHATSNAAFLSAAKAKRTESTDYYLGTTVDQIAAQQIGQRDAAAVAGAVDGPAPDGRPVRQRLRLRLSEQSLVVVADDAAAGRSASADRVRASVWRGRQRGRPARRAARQRASLLDSVRDDITRLQKTLGPGDRARVSQYLETVREVERRIQKAEAATADNPLPDLDRPTGVPAAYADHAQADVRPAGAGAAGRHHPRHHVPARARNQQPHLSGDRRLRSASPADPPRQRSGKDRARWRRSTRSTCRCSRISCEKLKATPEGDGSLLDHALVSLRQRHGQSERARSRELADHRRRRRARAA